MRYPKNVEVTKPSDIYIYGENLADIPALIAKTLVENSYEIVDFRPVNGSDIWLDSNGKAIHSKDGSKPSSPSNPCRFILKKIVPVVNTSDWWE